jgi:hypothetical protein
VLETDKKVKEKYHQMTIVDKFLSTCHDDRLLYIKTSTMYFNRWLPRITRQGVVVTNVHLNMKQNH